MDQGREGERLLEVIGDGQTLNETFSQLDMQKNEINRCFSAVRDERFASFHAQALRTTLSMNNFEIAQVLLNQDVSGNLVANQPDILTKVGQDFTHQNRHVPTMKSLLEHGADVNGQDGTGNTALYYACKNGDSDLYKLLIMAGADCFTLHDAFPSGDIGTSEQEPEKEPTAKMNLLEVALSARLQNEAVPIHPTLGLSHWEHRLEERWGYIVGNLIDKGLKARPEDPCLVKLLYIACYQGNLQYVEKLISASIDINARAGRSNEADKDYSSALHATMHGCHNLAITGRYGRVVNNLRNTAMSGGHKEVVVCLLAHGAEPNAKGGNLLFEEVEHLTPIEIGLRRPVSVNSQLLDEGLERTSLDAFEPLIEAGVDMSEAEQVLQECCKYDKVEMAKRLLARGTRIPQSLPCRSVEMVKLIENHGRINNPQWIQWSACYNGDLDLLMYLVKAYGPLIPDDSIGELMLYTIRSNRMKLLNYLLDGYGFDINRTFKGFTFGRQKTSLLRIACERLHVEGVRTLLKAGADPMCPGLEKSAFRAHLERATMVPKFDFFRTDFVSIVRLLLEYSGGQGILEDLWRHKLSIASETVANKPTSTDTLTASSWHLVDSTNVHQDTVDPPESQSKTDSTARMKQSDDQVLRTDGKEQYSQADHVEQDYHFGDASAINPLYFRPLAGLKAIRIAEIEPSESINQLIQVRLIHVNLADNPEFEVLAHNSEEVTGFADIKVDGKECSISLDLWKALQHLRAKDQPRRLWTRELCINWNVCEEKNQQIAILHETFQKATRALIWLGESGDRSKKFFRYVKTEKTRCDRIVSDEMGHLKDESDGDILDIKIDSEMIKKAWTELCERPVFYCPWTIPLMRHGKSPTIVCGLDSEEIKFLQGRYSYRHTEHTHDPSRNFHCLSHVQLLMALSDSRYSREFAGNPARAAKRPATAIEVARSCRAKDPRDKIFAVASALGEQNFQPDYNLSVTEVYRRFTTALINSSGDLKALHWLGNRHDREDLCSWVPDYSTPNPLSDISQLYENNLWQDGRRLVHHPNFRFDSDGNELICFGKHLGHIESISLEQSMSSMYPLDPLDNDRLDPNWRNSNPTWRNWEQVAISLKNKTFTEPLIEAFANTLVANEKRPRAAHEPELYFSEYSAAFHWWYTRNGTGILKNFDAKYFQNLELLRELVGGRHGVYYNQKVEQVCFGRRFFVTDTGSMGLAPSRSQKGDSIVFLPGAMNPFIVQERSDGTLVLVGDCYLYDLNWEKLMQDKTKRLQEFILR